MQTPFDGSHLTVMVGALPQAALVVSDNGSVITSNAKADELLEARAEGQPLAMVLRAPAVLQAVKQALNNHEASSIEHQMRGTVLRNLEVTVSPLGTYQTGEALALVMLHDLTYEEQVERMRADFVANASHELRTPLASLSGFIETMQGAAKNDTPAREKFLGLMQAQANRMSRLIDDLLSLSRIEMNEHLAPTDKVDLVSIVRQAAELLASKALEANCKLNFNFPATLPVRGDAGQLSQVAYNLIENAIKYASGKPVEVSVVRAGSSVVFSVRDHGPGIAAHHVPRLTERFYRVSANDSRQRGGTGLGLAIAKHIANRHRGRLLIESQLGVGSTFSLFLPAE